MSTLPSRTRWHRNPLQAKQSRQLKELCNIYSVIKNSVSKTLLLQGFDPINYFEER